MAARTQKNPLEQALGQFATPEERDNCLRVVHAALSTAMVTSLTDKTKPVDKKGAIAEAYAETIQLVESMMGGATSPYVPQKRTVLVANRSQIPSSNHNPS